MKQRFFALLFSLGLLAGCKKDGTSTSSQNPVIRYEIVSTAPMSTDGVNTDVEYTNATDQWESTNISSVTSWSKEITVSTSQRPYLAQIKSNLNMSQGGSVTSNIYINGVLKATQTNPSSQGVGVVNVNYTLQ